MFGKIFKKNKKKDKEAKLTKSESEPNNSFDFGNKDGASPNSSF